MRNMVRSLAIITFSTISVSLASSGTDTLSTSGTLTSSSTVAVKNLDGTDVTTYSVGSITTRSITYGTVKVRLSGDYANLASTVTFTVKGAQTGYDLYFMSTVNGAALLSNQAISATGTNIGQIAASGSGTGTLNYDSVAVKYSLGSPGTASVDLQFGAKANDGTKAAGTTANNLAVDLTITATAN